MQETEIIKQPQLNYAIHSLIASRWSPRAYDSRPIEPNKLQRIFEAGRWAASSSNMQPWFFLLGFKGDDVYEKIFSTLAEFNQLWVHASPVLCLAIAKTITSNGEENKSCEYDLGQAVANLSLQAISEDIYTHQIGGIDLARIAEILEIPSEYKVKVAFTLGYLGDPESLHPNLKKLEFSPRSRRLLNETVFTGKFGQPADFL